MKKFIPSIMLALLPLQANAFYMYVEPKKVDPHYFGQTVQECNVNRAKYDKALTFHNFTIYVSIADNSLDNDKVLNNLNNKLLAYSKQRMASICKDDIPDSPDDIVMGFQYVQEIEGLRYAHHIPNQDSKYLVQFRMTWQYMLNTWIPEGRYYIIYDTNTNQEVKLSDLLTVNNIILNKLSNKYANQLKRLEYFADNDSAIVDEVSKIKYPELDQDDRHFSAKGLNNFYLSGQGIVFVFTPHMMKNGDNSVEVLIEYEEIKDYLNPKYFNRYMY